MGRIGPSGFRPLAVGRTDRQPDDFAHAEVYATLATIRATLSEGWVATIELGPSGRRLAMVERSDYADR